MFAIRHSEAFAIRRPVARRLVLAIATSLGVAIGLATPEVGDRVMGLAVRGIDEQERTTLAAVQSLAREVARLEDPEFALRRHEFLAACALVKPDSAVRHGLVRMISLAHCDLRDGDPDPACRVLELYDQIGVTSVDQGRLQQLRSDPIWFRLKGRDSAGPLSSEEESSAVAEADKMTRIYLSRARILSGEPLDDLLRNHVTYLGLVREHGQGDVRLWRGISRLSQWALSNRRERGIVVARRLVRLFETVKPPPPPRSRSPSSDQDDQSLGRVLSLTLSSHTRPR